MTINSGLNGRAVRALVELGQARTEIEVLRSIIQEATVALWAGHDGKKVAEAIEDAMENLS